MRDLGSLLMKGLTMNLKLLIIILLFPLQVFAKEELKVLTYGSFNSDWGPGPNIEKEFESICNCDLIWSTADSSGALLSRVKLTKNNEGFDVLLGLDDSLITEADGGDGSGDVHRVRRDGARRQRVRLHRRRHLRDPRQPRPGDAGVQSDS